jgi:CubicO group peptidase (beta-lactamase class C family)
LVESPEDVKKHWRWTGSNFERSCFTAAALLALTLSAHTSFAQRPAGSYRGLEGVVLRELKGTNTPGAAVAVVRDNRVVYARGFGVASAETGAPVTLDMLFRVGSVTKMLTAAAFDALAKERRIAFDAPAGTRSRGAASASRASPRASC